MKLMHIADLHLGKVLNDFSLLEDQQAILEQIAGIAEEERVDAVLIAGDVYQRSTPPADAMAMFDAFITRLIQMKKKVFIISGNHDSAERVSYFSYLARASGVYITEAFDGGLQTIDLTDEYGKISFHMLPFLRPSSVRRFYPEEKILDYRDAVNAVLSACPIDPRVRNVLLCHQFITGAETSESEERMVGGLEDIPASYFDAFDYVALGHIHKAQRVSRDTLRYAGSPLKYSFSEADHKKSVCIIDLMEKNEISIRTRPLYPLRDLRLVEGKLDEVLSMPPSTDYVWVTVTDEFVPPDAKYTVTSVFPNLMRFSISNSKTRRDTAIEAPENTEIKDIFSIFSDFYASMNNGQAPTDAHMSVLREIMKELEENHFEAD